MRLALRWGAEFEQLIDGRWRPKDLRSGMWATEALKTIAALLAYADGHAYNRVCREDPEDVQRRLDALDPNDYPEVLAG